MAEDIRGDSRILN